MKNNNYPLLTESILRSKNEDSLYQPTSFWKTASLQILKEIESEGVENFRRLKNPLFFFVPTYGIPGNNFDKSLEEEIVQLISKKGGNEKQKLLFKKWMSGYSHALSDYRVFLSSLEKDNNFNLEKFTESQYGNPIEQFTFNNKKFSRSSLNYLLGLCFLNKFLTKKDKISNVLEIGGGFGTLGEILSFSKNKKYINLDIPPNSFISWNYLKNIYKKDLFNSLDVSRCNILDLPKCTVLNSWNIKNLFGKVDLFVNFLSFQEMEPKVVQNYFNFVKNLEPTWILLRNMREGKQKQTKINKVGVIDPMKTKNYIQFLDSKYSLVASDVLEFSFRTVDNYNSELLLFKTKNK